MSTADQSIKYGPHRIDVTAVKHKPASPLPWGHFADGVYGVLPEQRNVTRDTIATGARMADAAYIAHAANS